MKKNKLATLTTSIMFFATFSIVSLAETCPAPGTTDLSGWGDAYNPNKKIKELGNDKVPVIFAYATIVPGSKVVCSYNAGGKADTPAISKSGNFTPTPKDNWVNSSNIVYCCGSLGQGDFYLCKNSASKTGISLETCAFESGGASY